MSCIPQSPEKIWIAIPSDLDAIPRTGVDTTRVTTRLSNARPIQLAPPGSFDRRLEAGPQAQLLRHIPRAQRLFWPDFSGLDAQR
jgi:hypothetical protein